MSRRVWSAPGWAALVGVGVLAVAAPDAAEAVSWVPLLLGLILFALPHGAVDHHVPRRLGRAGGGGFILGYLAAVLAGLALWTLAPVVMMGAFLVVAGLHWGSGDAWYARNVHDRPAFTRRLDAVLFVAARGALPVALPTLAFPAELARGADAILGAVGGGSAAVLVIPDSMRVPGLLLVALLAGAAAASSAYATRGRGAWAGPVDIGELLLLGVFFTVTPAILAVGTYLLAWHAPRHFARLIAADRSQSSLPTLRGLVALMREAAPLTFVSLAGLSLLVVTASRIPASTDTLAGAGLALIAALTFPHAALVAWMDREQGVFAVSSSASGAHSTAGRASGLVPRRQSAP